ncbi:MAG: hypothetical protein QG608_2139 [Actinomycetota bacterium]|nr:hypothetical protein [Actinomycetota bacterium]
MTIGARRNTDLYDEAAAHLTQWREGDHESLELLVGLLNPLLWQVVRAYRLDSATSEDVLQTVWMTFIRRADTIEDPQAVVRWLTVTARRDALRASKAGQRVEVMQDEVLDLRTGVQDSPENEVLRADRDEALWRAVSGLSHRCQMLLRVVAFSPRPDYARLSAQLGMPMGSIGPTRGRCLEKLRTLLSAAGDWRTT